MPERLLDLDGLEAMVDGPGEEEIDEPEEDQDDPSIITVGEGMLYRVTVYLLFEVEDEGEEDEEATELYERRSTQPEDRLAEVDHAERHQ